MYRCPASRSKCIRTYDTRDRGRKGDFGYGWTLSLRDVRLEESRIVSADWSGYWSGGVFGGYAFGEDRKHLITITMPTGELYRFRPKFSPEMSPFVPPEVITISYEPVPGRQGHLGKLRALDHQQSEIIVYGNWEEDGCPLEILDSQTWNDYDNDLYEFTTDDGTVFVIDQNSGVQSITDPNGNTVTFTREGITHSSGRSVSFSRDADDRVTTITDPNGNTISYAYDTAGDLVQVVDQVQTTTTLTYYTGSAAHLLKDIIDPRGVRAIRNEYDDAGRLIKTTDAEGHPVTFTHNLDARREIVTNRLGYTSTYEYDQYGNVVKEIDPEGGITSRTYNDFDQVLTETDPNSITKRYTYDLRGNKTADIDGMDHATTYTYGANNEPLTITDPNGSTTTFTYDLHLNPT